jgi:hypothetical protein
MTVNTHCKELLEQGRTYHILYGDRLANHLSMALIALEKMGADQERLTRFYQSYCKKLVPLDRSDFKEPSNLLDTLGQGHQFNNHLSYYEQKIAEHGADQTLTESLPFLLPGICASAFHALIRLAYAIEANDSREIAYALAYWSSDYQPLGALSASLDNTLPEIIDEMSSIGENHTFGPGIIVDRMVEIAQLVNYQKSVFQPTNITLDQLAHLAIKAYLLTNDFTLLHGVTGCHALRIILSWISHRELALRCFWQAFVVAYLSTGSIPLVNKNAKAQKINDWDEIISKGRSSSNDHVIKIVYTCWSEHQHYENQEYLAAASRAIA